MTRPTDGIFAVVLQEQPAGTTVAVIYTSAPSITLPEIDAVGAGLVGGGQYTWLVTALGPASIDDITTGAGYVDTPHVKLSIRGQRRSPRQNENHHQG